MCGVDRTRTHKGKYHEQWVRKEVGPIPPFNSQQEKETYQKAIK
jgi:hypothetical protein